MARHDIIVFDFETGSRNPRKCQPTQIAAIALDGRNFRSKGTFNSLIKPIFDDEQAVSEGLDPVEDEALKITRKTREELESAPVLDVVWPKFADFVKKYNWQGTPFYAPVACGFNINGYDMHIVNRLCKKYGPWDNKRESQALFHPIYKVDLMDDMWLWTEADPNVKSISLDSVRERMGLSLDNNHDALQDVKDTANIFIKIQKSRRVIYRNMKFEKAFADGQFYV